MEAAGTPALRPLPTAAALSEALKSANQDVEAALHQDRTLERQRDCQGVLGIFQGVGVRLFAVSVAKLLLLAAVLCADASFTVWLMGHLRLEQALAVVAAVDLAAALLLLALLMGRRDAQKGLMVKRPAILPGSALTAALERAFQHTLAQYDGHGEPHES